MLLEIQGMDICSILERDSAAENILISELTAKVTEANQILAPESGTIAATIVVTTKPILFFSTCRKNNRLQEVLADVAPAEPMIHEGLIAIMGRR